MTAEYKIQEKMGNRISLTARRQREDAFRDHQAELFRNQPTWALSERIDSPPPSNVVSTGNTPTVEDIYFIVPPMWFGDILILEEATSPTRSKMCYHLKPAVNLVSCPEELVYVFVYVVVYY